MSGWDIVPSIYTKFRTDSISNLVDLSMDYEVQIKICLFKFSFCFKGKKLFITQGWLGWLKRHIFCKQHHIFCTGVFLYILIITNTLLQKKRKHNLIKSLKLKAQKISKVHSHTTVQATSDWIVLRLLFDYTFSMKREGFFGSLFYANSFSILKIFKIVKGFNKNAYHRTLYYFIKEKLVWKLQNRQLSCTMNFYSKHFFGIRKASFCHTSYEKKCLKRHTQVFLWKWITIIFFAHHEKSMISFFKENYSGWEKKLVFRQLKAIKTKHTNCLNSKLPV